jgi:hypothetical protein
MPGLQKCDLIIFYNTSNTPKFVRRESNVSGKFCGIQPEFCCKLIVVYVHMGRFTRLMAIPIEAIWAFSQYGRHKTSFAAFAVMHMI